MSDENPCRFKKVCKNCLKVGVDERPHMCIAIKCADYIICPKCKRNKTIPEGREFCYECLGISKSAEIKRRVAELSNGNVSMSSGVSGIRVVDGKITPPGTPPPGLNEDEILYYKSRWDDYKGYYRDPSAYFVCHLIILEEINITHLTDRLLATQLERQADIAKAHHTCVNTMKLLKDQLPDREAEEEMDDDKTIAAIYDDYCKEKKVRSIGGVSRLLSPEALALAPQLLFKIDPRTLLKRCGYKEIDIESVVEFINEIPEESKPSPEALLEFFGFKLKDEYALEYDSPLVDNINIEEEEEDDVHEKMET